LIEGKYSEKGYADMKIDSRVDRLEGGKVRIVYRFTEGESTKVGDLHIVGNRLTKRKVITRNINFHEGDPLSQDRFLTSQQRLYSLGLFDKVDIVPVNVAAVDSYRPVIIRVEDASPIILGYGIGYNDREKVRGTFDITHSNLFGLARSLSFRTRASYREQRGQITYKEPRLFNHDLDSYITLFAENAQKTGFSTFRTNASVQVLKRVKKLDNFFFRYNYEIVDLSDVYVNPLAVGFPEQNFGTLRLSSFSTAWLRDTRDDPFDATSGFFNTANVSVTAKPIGSETNFVSFFGQSQAHRKVNDAMVLATSLRLGLTRPFGSTPEVPISERFFAGGSTTLRGFGQDLAGPLDPTNVDPDTGEPLPLGGNAMVILNVETRFPLTRNFTLTPFYDTGNVFPRISTIRLSSFTNTLGFGFRYKTPFGPLRLDLGFNLDRDPRLPNYKIYFTVGNPF
jgi:outer membrane protein insertion porin family